MEVNFKDKYGDNFGIYPSPYDNRDWHLDKLIPRGAVTIPDSYESPLADFVYDQGNSSQCAACAYNYIRYLQERDLTTGGSGIDTKFAPSYNYGNRITGEDFEGMYLRSVCKKGTEDGSIPWDTFPGFYSYLHCKLKFTNNKDKWLEMGKPFAITSYYQCSDREQVMQAIIECKAVLGGIYVYDCLYNTTKNGIVEYDKNRDYRNYGGHAIVIIGYRKDENGKLWWKIVNSWGENWADNGTAWIPEDYPWLESPWALVDANIDTKWETYKFRYNL